MRRSAAINTSSAAISRFDETLILNQWMLWLFDKKNFEQLAEPFKSAQLEGLNEDNNRKFLAVFKEHLFDLEQFAGDVLLGYDQNIVRHTLRLNERRAEPIRWKYFRWPSLLFTKFYLDRFFRNRNKILADLNAFLSQFNEETLDVESRGSQSLLNVEAFRNPDEYKLRVERNGETQLVNVDLVETFNWLLGLTVKHIDVIRGVRVVEGTAPNGDRVLVLWRNIDQIDNDALDKWFEKQHYNTREMVYDVFYVNGDNNLENLRRLDQTWKVRLIEEEFKRLMFDVEDV